jgi:aminopeptidase
LTEKQFTTLHFRGPGTDLKIGMPENHLWKGGGGETLDGVAFSANLPTEEVFSLPHREKVDGVVHATKPLNYFGNLIENFSITFEKGRVVAFEAEKGKATLAKMIEADDGANMLGEVAIVPHRSPISESGLIFYNTLYDENAACHLALGSAYRSCVEGGTEMSDEELAEVGVNDSLIHVDFMIGSGDVDIDGINADGSISPIMRNGEWAFTV